MWSSAKFPILACWAYIASLSAWAVLHFAWGERLPALLVIDPFAIYLFAPLPLVLIVAGWLRLRSLLLCSGVLVLLGLWLFDGFGLTHLGRQDDGRPALCVMTYNVLGMRDNVQPTIRSVVAEDADVVMLQELNPRLASELVRSLGDRYPHRVLVPRRGTWGLGTISKFPIRASARTVSGRWGGKPQVLTLDWMGEAVTLINFHMLNPPASGSLELTERQAHVQHEAARALTSFVREERRSRAVIAAGDLNATHLSRTHAIVTEVLRDSWAEAGVGLGNTYPASTAPHLARVPLLGRVIPGWLIRIDYVFHSSQLEATCARTARFAGASDHRGVVVTLVSRKARTNATILRGSRAQEDGAAARRERAARRRSAGA